MANNIGFLDGLPELPGHLLPLRLDPTLLRLLRQPIDIARSAIQPAVAVEFYFVHLFPLSLMVQSNKVKHRPQFFPSIRLLKLPIFEESFLLLQKNVLDVAPDKYRLGFEYPDKSA